MNHKDDFLYENAKMLVKGAHIHAVGLLLPLLNEFPVLEQVDVEHWDFILTIAGVFMAATRLNNLRLGDKREDKLMEAIALDLDKWDSDGIRAFEDCKGLFEKVFDQLTASGLEPLFVASDAIGTWIVWNVLGRKAQTHEEYNLIRAVGIMVTSAFFDWWELKK